MTKEERELLYGNPRTPKPRGIAEIYKQHLVGIAMSCPNAIIIMPRCNGLAEARREIERYRRILRLMPGSNDPKDQ